MLAARDGSPRREVAARYARRRPAALGPGRAAQAPEGLTLRLVFLGTPPAAAVILASLVDAGHDVALVVTRPDARRSRRAAPSPSPVSAAAQALDLEVTHEIGDVRGVSAEIGVVVAYGRIIRPPVLGSMPLVNVHFSLLPRWRGAAPVERAILAGDTHTGVCLMELEAGLDTGPVYARRAIEIGADETGEALTGRLARLGADLLVKVLADGLGAPEPQVGASTYAAKLSTAELELSWQRPAGELARLVRVGRAWTTWRGKRLLILAARAVDGVTGPPGALAGVTATTGRGVLLLERVQPEGRVAVEAEEWVRGAHPAPGERLGQ